MRTTWTSLADKIGDFNLREIFIKIRVFCEEVASIIDSLQSNFNSISWISSLKLYRCRVFHSANQSIPNNAWTSLAFNSEYYDDSGMHDTATNNGRITIRRDGKYDIGGVAHFEGAAGGVRWGRILLNGATAITTSDGVIPGSTVGNAVNPTNQYSLVIGDYIEFQVFQNSGGAINVLASPTANFLTADFWSHIMSEN